MLTYTYRSLNVTVKIRYLIEHNPPPGYGRVSCSELYFIYLCDGPARVTPPRDPSVNQSSARSIKTGKLPRCHVLPFLSFPAADVTYVRTAAEGQSWQTVSRARYKLVTSLSLPFFSLLPSRSAGGVRTSPRPWSLLDLRLDPRSHVDLPRTPFHCPHELPHHVRRRTCRFHENRLLNARTSAGANVRVADIENCCKVIRLRGTTSVSYRPSDWNIICNKFELMIMTPILFAMHPKNQAAYYHLIII